MQLKSLNHIGIVVEDLDQSQAFYVDFLGMVVGERPKNFKFGGRWFQSDGFDVHIILASDTTASAGIPDAGEGKKLGYTTHFAFEVTDLNSYIEKANQLNIEIAGGPMSRGSGATQIYFQDPDGYIVELFEFDGSGSIGEAREALNG